MNLKEAIDIYKNLVDNIIIQSCTVDIEIHMPSEDAEFMNEDFLELDVIKVVKLPSADYCIIYLD